MTRKVIYLVAAKFLFDWKARRPFPPVSLALRDAGVTKKSISWDIRSGNPRSIVFFSTGVCVCLYGLGLANVRVRPAGIETVCLARPRREVVSIYRRQQGIRTAILSKRDPRQIRKFVRGCSVYEWLVRYFPEETDGTKQNTMRAEPWEDSGRKYDEQVLVSDCPR